MLEKIFAFIFWLNDIFTSSRDPFIAEYRKYWRHMVVFSMVTLMGLFFTMLIAPTDAPATGVQLAIKNFYELLYLASLAVTFSAAISFMWTAYRYWVFVDGAE